MESHPRRRPIPFILGEPRLRLDGAEDAELIRLSQAHPGMGISQLIPLLNPHAGEIGDADPSVFPHADRMRHNLWVPPCSWCRIDMHQPSHLFLLVACSVHTEETVTGKATPMYASSLALFPLALSLFFGVSKDKAYWAPQSTERSRRA